MESPASPDSGSYVADGNYKSAFFPDNTDDGADYGQQSTSAPSKRAARLSDRIQNRLNKRGTSVVRGSPSSSVTGGSSTGGGSISASLAAAAAAIGSSPTAAAPLSPRSEPGSGVVRSTSSRGEGGASVSEQSTGTADSARLLLQKKKSANRSYEERVNSLLLTREEDDSDLEDGSRNKDLANKTNDTSFITPNSTLDHDFKSDPPAAAHTSPDSMDLSSQGSGSTDGGENDDDSSTHYSTPDDDDDDDEGDDDSSNSGSSSSGSHSSRDSGSTRSLETGRSFSPIYEGMNQQIKMNHKDKAGDKSKKTKEAQTGKKETIKSSRRNGINAQKPRSNVGESQSQTIKTENKTVEEGRAAPASAPNGSSPPSIPVLGSNNVTPTKTKDAAAKADTKNVEDTKPSVLAAALAKKAASAEKLTVDNGEEASGSLHTTASPRNKSISPSQRSPRSRIPGGAAAKLMLLGPKASEDSSDDGQEGGDGDDVEIPKGAVDEIGLTLTKSKNEFSVGSEGNRRYYPMSSTSREDGEDGESQRIPSPKAPHLAQSTLFDRSEVFHQTASAAVTSLLTPRSAAATDSQSCTSGAAATPTAVGAPSDIQPAMSMLSTTPSVMSSAFQAPIDNSAAGPFESLARRDVSLQLITEETEKKLERLKDTMKDPNKRLADLLTAIHTSDDFNPDLGFTVRRKNACGALQVMTAQAERRVPIAWTVGVLPALTSVLRDTGEDGLHVSFPDKRHRIEFEAARNRAIACLMNLSTPPKNRIAIFHTPGLVQWLVTICDEGHGIPRKGACTILAYLGKTPENKLLMVKVPGLVAALERVLKPLPPRVERIKVRGKKTKDEDSDNDESKSNESEVTPRFSGSHSAMEIDGYDETADELLQTARQSVFALLIHLAKEKDNAYHLARHDLLTSTLSSIARYHESPSHVLAVKMIAALTRHRLNTKVLVFKQRDVVPALVNATTSKNDDTRLFSCYALQNLAQDKSCRQELAVAPGLISAICDRCRKAKAEDERLAAISAIKNLCDEPANLIPMTNTPDCIATLMHLAHGMEEGISEIMQYRACDALATLSHWLRKIATSGQALENAKTKKPPPKTLFVPSLQVVDYNQWK